MNFINEIYFATLFVFLAIKQNWPFMLLKIFAWVDSPVNALQRCR